jgi:ribonuclease BN (tRNA processing enzyme)
MSGAEKMRLTVIGSGDAFGSGGRFNTCFLIEAQGKRMLLDCGASSPVALKARGIDPATVDGVLLSHLHGDHFGGLPFLLLDFHFLGRRETPFSIAGPPGTRERLDAACEIFFPRSSQNKWRFRLDVNEIAPGIPGEFLGYSVATVEVIHFSGAPSTAVRLSAGGRTLAYSGDTQWTDALVKIAAGADLFICECYDYDRDLPGHMSWATLKSNLPRLRAKRIMLTHMNPSMLAKAEEARSAGVVTAEDGATMEL